MVVEPPPDYLLPRDKQFTWTEHRAQKALINCLDVHQHHAFPNVMLGAGEMDMAVLSKRGYLTEIEIKLSAADWRRDKYKEKWLEKNAAARAPIKFFCYAVPVELMNAMPEDINSNAGIIALFWDYTIRGYCTRASDNADEKRWKVWGQWAKRPKPFPQATPVTDDTRQRLFASIYHRFWSQLNDMSVLDPRLNGSLELDVDQPPTP